jgi:hypothetical protein
MRNLISTYKLYILGILLGGIAGYLYWRFYRLQFRHLPYNIEVVHHNALGMLRGILIASPSKKRQEKPDIENTNKSINEQE